MTFNEWMFGHALPLLRRLHRVHHADADIDLTTGARRFPAPAGTTVSA